MWAYKKFILSFAVEVEQMLLEVDQTLPAQEPADLDWPWWDERPELMVYSHESTYSGGYAEHVFRFAARELFNDARPIQLQIDQPRNRDLKEFFLEKDGIVLLRFAIANGFKNIQNLVQKLKRGKGSKFHFVEIMACPSGCINGGAQVRPISGQHVRELTQKLEELYTKLPRSQPDNIGTKKLYDDFFDGFGTDKSHNLLHTSYHSVDKLIPALNIKW